MAATTPNDRASTVFDDVGDRTVLLPPGQASRPLAMIHVAASSDDTPTNTPGIL